MVIRMPRYIPNTFKPFFRIDFMYHFSVPLYFSSSRFCNPAKIVNSVDLPVPFFPTSATHFPFSIGTDKSRKISGLFFHIGRKYALRLKLPLAFHFVLLGHLHMISPQNHSFSFAPLAL